MKQAREATWRWSRRPDAPVDASRTSAYVRAAARAGRQDGSVRRRESFCGNRRVPSCVFAGVHAGVLRRSGWRVTDAPASRVTRAYDLSMPSIDTLYRTRYAPMVRLAYLLVGDAGTAEELVQDAFVRVAPRVESTDAPAAYLRTAVVNACRSHLRHLRVQRTHLRTLRPVDGASDTPDELFDALAQLAPRPRAAVILRYYEDLSEAEIATALDCRPGTVKSMLHRALAQLRTALGEDSL